MAKAKELAKRARCSRSEQKKRPIQYPGNTTEKWLPTIDRCQSNIRTSQPIRQRDRKVSRLLFCAWVGRVQGGRWCGWVPVVRKKRPGRRRGGTGKALPPCGCLEGGPTKPFSNRCEAVRK
jgi:hypothetical protein